MINRKRRAYTLLEVVVVAVVTSVLFLLGTRWILALTTAANAPLFNRSGTQISYALDKLENDLRLADDCDVYGNGGSPLTLDPAGESLSVTIDSPNGQAEKVSWRLKDGDLQRASVEGANCSYPEPEAAAWSTIVSGVSGNPTLFTPVKSGVETVETDSAQAVKVNVKSLEGKASTVRTISVS